MSLSDGRRSDGYERRSDGSVALLALTSGAGRMPRTVGDCRGPGVCPIFRCKFNVALHVTEAGTIVTGGRGSTAEGESMPLKRRSRGQVRYDDIDAFVAALIERVDALESTCALDYAERDGMLPGQVAEVLGISRERVRQIIAKAVAGLARDEDVAESLVDLVGRVR